MAKEERKGMLTPDDFYKIAKSDDLTKYSVTELEEAFNHFKISVDSYPRYSFPDFLYDLVEYRNKIEESIERRKAENAR